SNAKKRLPNKLSKAASFCRRRLVGIVGTNRGRNGYILPKEMLLFCKNDTIFYFVGNIFGNFVIFS
ncbi:MAG: hypothetical protein ACI4UO_04270, partial [Paludibacteraceae bacterium]